MITDDFNSGDGDPGANWTDTHDPGASIVSNRLKGDSADSYSGTRYSGSAWNTDHSSQCLVSVTGYCGPAVRMSSGTNWYCYFDMGSVQECIGGGTPVEIAVFGAFFNGETPKLVATSTTLEGFIGAVSQGSVVDSSLSSGVPGVMFYNTANPQVDDWVGTGEATGPPPNDARIVIRAA